jgi:hypothetical protein
VIHEDVQSGPLGLYIRVSVKSFCSTHECSEDLLIHWLLVVLFICWSLVLFVSQELCSTDLLVAWYINESIGPEPPIKHALTALYAPCDVFCHAFSFASSHAFSFASSHAFSFASSHAFSFASSHAFSFAYACHDLMFTTVLFSLSCWLY